MYAQALTADQFVEKLLQNKDMDLTVSIPDKRLSVLFMDEFGIPVSKFLGPDPSTMNALAYSYFLARVRKAVNMPDAYRSH